MKVLVIGGGGREHAIVEKLKTSPKVSALYCAPGNGGIAASAQCVDIKATDVAAMVGFALREGIDFVCVTPDDPLAAGMVDAMEAAGIPAFGPDQKAAQLEASKVFCKDLLAKYQIPTAEYGVFDDPESAKAYIKAKGAPIVVKADGLALGKGVFVAATQEQALEAVDAIMVEGRFGAAGARVLVEECLQGPEVSVMCFTDGKTIVPMVPSQDHKRAYDGDRGPNTGGMGVVAPTPFYTPELARKVMDTILMPTVQAMEAEGRPFKGVLYAGLMLTEGGPKVLEYNARFGDPETQAVLPLLEGDLLEIFMAVREGRLKDCPIAWKTGASALVVLAAGGYPGGYEKGNPITGLEDIRYAAVYHAGTAIKDGRLVTAGGRVLGVSAQGKTLGAALKKAYAAADKIHFKDAFCRRDIGAKIEGGTL
jgi:phosphoribosylamine--glycine ligase